MKSVEDHYSIIGEGVSKSRAGQLSIIGKRLPRYDAEELVTGKAQYTQDVYLPRMLWGMMLLSPHAHADIVSIDTSQAEALPGVKAVITYKDVEKYPDNYFDAIRLYHVIEHLDDPVKCISILRRKLKPNGELR